MNEICNKIRYLLKGYNPYPFYWFDLLTGRKLKYRIGKCIDCFNCCKYVDGSGYCAHVDVKTKRCNIYNKRNCDKWFPISQKELNYRKSIHPGFRCKFNFKK